MNRATALVLRWLTFLTVGGFLLTFSWGAVPPPRPAPKLEPMAETRLLMEGLAQANFRGLERQLQQKPAEVEAWRFIRGQALLIAETGNLLMIRPPRNAGEGAWMDHGTALRTVAGRLAQAANERDYDRCRAGMTEVANACNACHQTFRVPTRITPFAEPPERRADATPRKE